MAEMAPNPEAINIQEAESSSDEVLKSRYDLNTAEEIEYFRSHRDEIERDEAGIANELLQAFNSRYQAVTHPEQIPQDPEECWKLLNHDSLNRQMYSAFMNTSVQWKDRETGEEINADNPWREISFSDDYGQPQLASLTGQYGEDYAQRIWSHLRKIILAEVDKKKYSAQLEIMVRLMQHYAKSKSRQMGPEEDDIPVYWYHSFPIGNIKHILNTGKLESRSALLAEQSPHTAMSGAAMFDKPYPGYDKLTRLADREVYGNIEFPSSDYSGWIPGLPVFPDHRSAQAWIDQHAGDGIQYWAQDLETASNHTTECAVTSEDYRVAFFKPVQMIAEESQIRTSPMYHNDRRVGVAFDEVDLSGGKFFVYSDVAKKYLIESGVPEDKIFLEDNFEKLTILRSPRMLNINRRSLKQIRAEASGPRSEAA